jgi:hypothetical protein
MLRGLKNFLDIFTCLNGIAHVADDKSRLTQPLRAEAAVRVEIVLMLLAAGHSRLLSNGLLGVTDEAHAVHFDW